MPELRAESVLLRPMCDASAEATTAPVARYPRVQCFGWREAMLGRTGVDGTFRVLRQGA